MTLAWQERRAEYLREKGAREWAVICKDGRVKRVTKYEEEPDVRDRCELRGPQNVGAELPMVPPAIRCPFPRRGGVLPPGVPGAPAGVRTGPYHEVANRAEGAEECECVMADENPEVCVCAAIRLPDLTEIRGRRHHDCFSEALARGYHLGSLRRCLQGFRTSHGRFVSREEGRKIQDAAGIPSASPRGYVADTLFSEDLY